MKKFYSYALAALALASTAFSTMAEATTAEKMCGTYTWRFRNDNGDWQSPENKAEAGEVSIAVKSGNTVTVTGLAGAGVAVDATIYPATGTLSIPRTVVGTSTEDGQTYKHVLELMNYDTKSYKLVASDEPIVFTFHNGVYVPVDNQGLQVAKYAESDITAAGFKKAVVRRISNTFWGDLTWTLLGTTEYVDNFISGYFHNPVEAKTVTVYKAEGIDVFKVEGALDALAPGLNPMIINAINPDAVHVPVQYTGYVDPAYTMTSNQGVQYTGEVWIADAGTLYAGQALNSYCAGTYKDGVITFPNGTGNINWPNGYDMTLGKSSAATWTTKYSGATTLTIPTPPTAVTPPTQGEWVKTSTGIWYEGPIGALYNTGLSEYEVDVYTNTEAPGWYRLNPYDLNSPLGAEVIKYGFENKEYLYINASDPNKVYMTEWVTFGNTYLAMKSDCEEVNLGTTVSKYGTLNHGTVLFEPGTLLYTMPFYGQFDYEPYKKGAVKFALDKNNFKDYSCTVEIPFCSTTADATVKFVTKDIVKVKIAAAGKPATMNETYEDLLPKIGMDLSEAINNPYKLQMPEGFYTLLWVGLDADNKVVNKGYKYFSIINDNPDDWKSVGKGDLTDGVVAPFLGYTPEELEVDVEESVSQPGYYRVVNPYKNCVAFGRYVYNHSVSGNHNHYLYINAVDPNRVMLKPSVPGYKTGSNGNAAFYSAGFEYFVNGQVAQGDAAGAFGTMKDGVITISKDANGESNIFGLLDAKAPYFKRQNYVTDFKLAIRSNSTGVADLNAAEGEVEYYTIQGVKVQNPAKGQLVIVRKGGKTEKVVF